METLAPYAERRALPAEMRLHPRWSALIGGSTLGGIVLGALTHRKRSRGHRIARTVFFGSAFGYLTTALLDFWEHQRMEKAVTGHYGRWVVVPPGETANHLLQIANVVGMLAWAQPRRRPRRWSDVWQLVAPGLFLALGWRDEMVYHRRRATRREDIMHTTSHLASGVMLTALYTMRALG
jgi:hypothetical protein